MSVQIARGETDRRHILPNSSLPSCSRVCVGLIEDVDQPGAELVSISAMAGFASAYRSTATVCELKVVEGVFL
eukprot:m.19373 g.19373  ORF g.19373 m.19373 type:complete len:73 (+) comp9941_c1_seq1:2-220(+)